MAKLIAVQLETCHHNTDACAWYAYYEGDLVDDPETGSEAWYDALEKGMKAHGGPLGHEWAEDNEEVPNDLSRHAGLRRYLVATGC